MGTITLSRAVLDDLQGTDDPVMRAWLATVLDDIAAVAGALDITLSAAIAGGATSVVVGGACADGLEVVCKADRDHARLALEVHMLEALAERAMAPDVLHAQAGICVMVRAVPGDPLAPRWSCPPDARRAGASVVESIARLDGPLPVGGCLEALVRDRLDALERRLAARDLGLPAGLGATAGRVAEGLLGSAPDPVVCHGDLHSANVIGHGDGWWLIDPHPLLGELAWEIAWFAAHCAWRDPGPLALAIADDVGVDAERTLAWASVVCADLAVSCAWNGRPRTHAEALARSAGRLAAACC